MLKDIKPLDRKYYTTGAEVYRKKADGSSEVILHSTKSTVRNIALSLLNEEYYGALVKQIDMLQTTEQKLQELANASYKLLKPIIADGGELGEQVYRIVHALFEMSKEVGNAKQVLRQRNGDI